MRILFYPALFALLGGGITWVSVEHLWPLGLFMLIGALIDIHARDKERRLYRLRKCSTQTLERLKHSACQRAVAIHLWGEKAKEYYRAHGYRGWHILPDGFPWVMGTRKWWRSFFH